MHSERGLRAFRDGARRGGIKKVFSSFPQSKENNVTLTDTEFENFIKRCECKISFCKLFRYLINEWTDHMGQNINFLRTPKLDLSMGWDSRYLPHSPLGVCKELTFPAGMKEGGGAGSVTGESVSWHLNEERKGGEACRPILSFEEIRP